MRRDATVQMLESHLPELRRDFGVSSLSLFGSLARDECTKRATSTFWLISTAR